MMLQVVRIHHDTYIASTDHHKERCQQRDDITLLVRNFNYPLPNSVNSPTSSCTGATALGSAGSKSTTGGGGGMTPLSLVIPTSPTQQV